jgi:hypothetical protein
LVGTEIGDNNPGTEILFLNFNGIVLNRLLIQRL